MNSRDDWKVVRTVDRQVVDNHMCLSIGDVRQAPVAQSQAPARKMPANIIELPTEEDSQEGEETGEKRDTVNECPMDEHYAAIHEDSSGSEVDFEGQEIDRYPSEYSDEREPESDDGYVW